jgi:hypothetical protein
VTPLRAAVGAGREKAMAALIERGAEATLGDEGG